MTRTYFGELTPRQLLAGMEVCHTQALGPKVVTRQGPCRKRVLLSSLVLPRAGQAEERFLAGLEGLAEPSVLVYAQLLLMLTFFCSISITGK